MEEWVRDLLPPLKETKLCVSRSKENAITIDWGNREIIENFQMHILQIVSFLNKFGTFKDAISCFKPHFFARFVNTIPPSSYKCKIDYDRATNQVWYILLLFSINSKYMLVIFVPRFKTQQKSYHPKPAVKGIDFFTKTYWSFQPRIINLR